MQAVFLCSLYSVLWKELQGSHNNSQNRRLNQWIFCVYRHQYFIFSYNVWTAACNVRDVAKESSAGFFISQAGFLLNCTFKITPCLCSLEQFELVIRSFSVGGKLAGARLLLWESKFSFHTHKLGWPVEILKHTFKYVAFSLTASCKLY